MTFHKIPEISVRVVSADEPSSPFGILWAERVTLLRAFVTLLFPVFVEWYAFLDLIEPHFTRKALKRISFHHVNAMNFFGGRKTPSDFQNSHVPYSCHWYFINAEICNVKIVQLGVQKEQTIYRRNGRWIDAARCSRLGQIWPSNKRRGSCFCPHFFFPIPTLTKEGKKEGEMDWIRRENIKSAVRHLLATLTTLRTYTWWLPLQVPLTTYGCIVAGERVL